MNKLVNREIGEYIIEYDSSHSQGVYQFSGLKIRDIDGDIISIHSIYDDEVDENEINVFRELQKKIQNVVGSYFECDNVEKFIKREFNLPINGIEISIEPM